MTRAPGELALKSYTHGRRAERRLIAEDIEMLAEHVGALCAFAYLDGREDAGEEQGDLDEERAEIANRVRVDAIAKFRARTRMVGLTEATR